MKVKSIVLLLFSFSFVYSSLSWSHSAMYRDSYEYDNSNEGLSAIHLQMISGKAVAVNQCVDGAANGYPCKKVDLQAILPKASMGGGSQNLNDIWGWTDPSNGKEIAIVGRTHGTAFVDVSNPTTPVHLGFLPSHNNGTSSWRDVKVYNDHAFIVADGSGNSTHGLQIFDLRKLRTTQAGATLTETAHLGGFGNAHNIAINEDSGFAYVVGSNQCSGGLYMVNITNPASPTYAGCFSSDGYTHDAQCVNYAGPDSTYQGKEICVAYNEDTITIVNVSDKSNPVQISRKGYSGSRYTHQGWFLNDQHTTLIMNDELDEQGSSINTTSYIWNVTDLDNPVEIGRYVGPTKAIDHNLYTLNNYVIESNYRAGLRILKTNDISNGNMSEVAYFDTIPSSNSAQFSGTWSNYPYFASGNIIMSDIGTGLFIVKPDWTAIGNDTTPPASYCEAKGNSANDEWISKVTVGSFNNSSSGAGYTDFTSKKIPLAVGANAITLTPGYRGTAYREHWKIWIDYDGDSTFSAAEQVYDSGSASNSAVSGTITVPSSAKKDTRMRVAMRYNTAPSACGSYDYGEVEDYTVTFGGVVNPPSTKFENTTSYNIPDNNATGISSPVTSTHNANVSNVSVAVNITHTYKGDLVVDLIHPDGQVFNMHNRSGGSTDNIIQTFSVNVGSKTATGIWNLRVKDLANADTGKINSWSITF